MTRVAIVHGHPDPTKPHFNHALAEAYAAAARDAGHDVREIHVARMAFSLLRSKSDWEEGPVPPTIREAQETLQWAGHLVIFYPLWMGSEPALLKGFLEQTLRPGFAVPRDRLDPLAPKLLTGRSARVVVTMGMPALIYRWYFGAHSLKNLKRNILGFCGYAPIKDSVIGTIDAKDGSNRAAWLARMKVFGRAAI
jgi:putative NADPH-quinone reductase